MSERDVIVTSWIYDDATRDALIEELRKPYTTSLRVHENRVVCVNDAVQGMVIMEVEEAIARVCKRMPDCALFKVVVIPEVGAAVTYEGLRGSFRVVEEKSEWIGSGGATSDYECFDCGTTIVDGNCPYCSKR